MRIHYLQHVPFEGPEQIAVWAVERGHTLNGTSLFEPGAILPVCEDFDMLVVMGGPMGVYDEAQYSWLRPEKELIQAAIRQGKLVLGICLGAQLIAEAIGGTVYKNVHKEIGWHPVQLKSGDDRPAFFNAFPEQFTPFHWHGDTFDLPEGAEHVAFSAGCRNQAFVYAGCAVGLQFHLESSEASIQRLIDHCGEDLEEEGVYVWSPASMLNQTEWLRSSNELLFGLLDAIEASGKEATTEITTEATEKG